MKNRLLLTVFSVLLNFVAIGVAWGAEPTVVIDNELISFDVAPVIEKGRTLVPLRVIFEKLGADVQWDQVTNTVFASKGNTVIKLPVNSAKVLKNGAVFSLDVPAKVKNGRTLVPLRFVSEALGAKVSWNEKSNEIIIISGYINDTVEGDYSKHIAKWMGIIDGKNGGFIFKRDGTVTFILDDKEYGLRYDIDYSKNPIWVDLIYDSGTRAKMIAKFNGENELYFKIIDGTNRPTKFDSNVIKTKRIDYPDPGKIVGTQYYNKYFGVNMYVPDDWTVANKQDNDLMLKIGEDMYNAPVSISCSDIETPDLITVSKYPVTASVSSNPLLACFAESVSGKSYIKSGYDYLVSFKSTLLNMKVKYTFDKDIYIEKIGNKDFYVLEATMEIANKVVKQKVYCTIIKDYVLGVSLTYQTEQELEQLNSMLNTLAFK